MLIKRLELGDQEVNFSSWPQVERALEQLRDSPGQTLALELEPEEWYMDIYGVENGGFLTSVYSQGKRHHLSNPSIPEDALAEVNIEPTVTSQVFSLRGGREAPSPRQGSPHSSTLRPGATSLRA